MRTATILLLSSVAALAFDEEVADEIIVTGTRILEEWELKVPIGSIGSRDVFGPDRIKETGARDINDLLQNIPALSTRPYNGGEAAAPSISMRGLPDDGLTEYVHILIDGVPASPLPYGWTAFSFLPITPDRLYAIDYIRGGHAVRYSPNTVGGVLNLITPPIPGAPTLFARTTFGDFDYRSTLLAAGFTKGRVGLLGTFVDRRGDGYRRNGAFDQKEFHVKGRWDIDEDSWIAASAGHMESNHQAPGGLTQAQFAADRFGNARPDNRFDGHRFVFDTVYHRDTSDRDWYEAFLYVSKTKRRLRAQRPHFGAATEILDWTDDSWFVGVGARVRHVMGDHTLYGGVRYQREWIPGWEIRSGGALTRDSEYTLDTLSLHVDDTWRPTEKLTVVAGFRIEWVPTAEGSDAILGFTFDDDFFAVLPGGGASYVFNDRVAVFANYYMGFRAPQVWGFGSATGSGALDFEEGNALECGARLRGWRGVTGSVTYWRTEYDNFGVFFTGFYENLGKIVANGVDLEAEWQCGDVWESLDGLSLHGSVTVQDSELRSGPNRGNETPYAWETKAAWRARYERSGFVASFGGTFVGDSFSDDANTAVANPDGNLGVNPSRTIWDARLAKRFDIGEKGDLEIGVGATNLFDKQWFVHSRGGFFGGGLVSGAPRQVYVSFHFSLSW